MIFKEENRIIYCMDDIHNSKFDRGPYFLRDVNFRFYYSGYLVHREDGPAIEMKNLNTNLILNTYKNGLGIAHSEWFFKGKRHRTNGPAVEWINGQKFWYINGKEYSEQEYWNIINLRYKNKVLNEI